MGALGLVWCSDVAVFEILTLSELGAHVFTCIHSHSIQPPDYTAGPASEGWDSKKLGQLSHCWWPVGGMFGKPGVGGKGLRCAERFRPGWQRLQ